MEYENLLSTVGGTVIGFLITVLWERSKDRRKFRRDLESAGNINVAGHWHAAWQAAADGNEILNTEELILEQKASTIKIWNKNKSPENPRGGYLWEGQLTFYQGRDLLGWYFPKKEENTTSKGIMFINYDSSKKIFIGKWVGSSFDGPLCSGFVVISKDKSEALVLLQAITAQHPQNVDIISTTLSGNTRLTPSSQPLQQSTS